MGKTKRVFEMPPFEKQVEFRSIFLVRKVLNFPEFLSFEHLRSSEEQKLEGA